MRWPHRGLQFSMGLDDGPAGWIGARAADLGQNCGQVCQKKAPKSHIFQRHGYSRTGYPKCLP
ncbi:hypothetical protein NITLEN_20281 [Nitrospira lenta]|uniref:Uncharacterized protein n=1 Tax=Nitrospira lenta TaxID=1436998 RepID=A0A330L4D0_9BACT|nr:hypothetical protein NITLEN_20281 [Nitrospira lenta]